MKTPPRIQPQTEDLPVNPALYSYPSKLFVEVTTRCNLRCPMCSKQSPGCGIVEGDMSTETFDRIVPAFSRLQALILTGSSPPFQGSRP